MASTETDPGELLDREEVARRTRLSVRQIDRLISRGELIPTRIGRRVLVSERDLTVFLAARRVLASQVA